ncbi:apolipoprotein N-acyltransferase [Denitrificimonas sp. JX-1]|uniref:Apolipoprotein N-acyltransferase n=1 Tax=Denitrificimonas halotolerans TaxID=3098930 RepID=A0ABU5GTR5_9GAMM|nr:apolipoprotein N-acyltransferase [Denitrificimonas sp. JX-1]MDY7220189.1 apolipoprotein N-acyltransferase [Denitrificimonas sp. JX-1]
MQWLIQRGWLGNVLALTVGALITLALAPFNFWALALIACSVLYLSLSQLSPSQAALRGWAFGLGMFTSGTSWVYVSIHDYGAAPPFLAGFLTAVFVAGLSLFLALFGWLWARFIRQQQHTLSNAWAFAALWVTIEAFRGWFLTGFPWLYLGYSQLDGPLSGLAPLGGVWLISFALVLTSVLLVTLLLNKQRLSRCTAVISILALWGLGFTLQAKNWTETAGEPLTVTAIQGNIEQNLKWDPAQIEAQLALYQTLTLNAAASDLIIWPETAVPILKDQAQGYLNSMERIINRQNSALITGLPLRQYDSYGDLRYYNAITTLGDSNGEYLKQKLVPFGEYVPLQEMLRGLIAFFDLPMSDFARGPSKQAPLDAKGYKIAPYICYEVVYPEFATELAAQSDILLTISNDTWFGTSIGPWQHLQMAQMRALEAGRWMIRSTNNGISALIDPKGQINATIPQFEQSILRGSVVPMQGLTPYLRWQSWPLILLSALCLVLAFVQRKLQADA